MVGSIWTMSSPALGLVLTGLFFGLCGQLTGQSGLSDHLESCSEPPNLVDLYTHLREMQIADAGRLQPMPSQGASQTGSVLTTTTSERSGQVHIRLAGHHGSGQSTGTSGLCRCEAIDELSHESGRIPRILAQSSCRPYCPHRSGNFSVKCEEIYTQVRVKRRHGCLDGVYQYRDAWQAIPIGCRCHVYPRLGATRG
ncbi:hypothetical protein EGW08_002254 [Elysia chlorotica]|uniref:CTCK domain-containing protein n=1 Tax=Elysia chlorotica TaxID=188477 RepID=A0A433U854_ELYCH|nr:hypothetical protein EGW08_002254 [Elysia chlorotica]